jgi:DNA (cytosine-5)-methyltransferase 1
MNKSVLSLFSSAGIGELGIEAAGYNILVSNEIRSDRVALYRENHPKVQTICGDVWKEKDNIIRTWRSITNESPFLVYATPPCQGMSSNGTGKLLREYREGRRPKEDPRNRLIIPTMEIVCNLHPHWLLLENVPNMDQTIITDENGNPVNIIDYIENKLGNEYVGKAEVVNCADYGIPQSRKRLITIFTRDAEGEKYYKSNHNSFLPPRTHCDGGDLFHKPWVTLRDAIGNLPPLTARLGENENIEFNKYHIVPIIDEEKLFWIHNTKEGDTAYNNQCSNPKCGFQGNPVHGSNYDSGIHQSNKQTPIYCAKCGSLLPRPTVIDKNTGERRLIRGFDTAYRRMEWDKPAPTLTQKMHSIASDKKIHPSQDRALSLYEAMIIQTISDYNFDFSVDGKQSSRNMICQVIGESVPPKLIEIICENIIKQYEIFFDNQ